MQADGIGDVALWKQKGACQDRLHQLILEMLQSFFVLGPNIEFGPVVAGIESLLIEHHISPQVSRLRELLPGIGAFFTPLPFVEAFRIYDEKYRITKRRFIPPTEDEIRHIFNVAQIVAVGREDKLRMITFDGDETLYPDGQNFTDLQLAEVITMLLEKGVAVALVTAAGYGYQSNMYEARLAGLLEHFKQRNLGETQLANFFTFGGECNYLLRCGGDFHLHAVSEESWVQFSDVLCSADFVVEHKRLLDVAERALRGVIKDLSLRGRVIRKERAVGLVPGGQEGRTLNPKGSGETTIKREVLEEAVVRIRSDIADARLTLPYCAFNGGHDVWVDVGNKAEGVRILQRFLNIEPRMCLHIGDQFGLSGNDLAARNVAPCIWIQGPEETKAVLRGLLKQLNLTIPSGYTRDTTSRILAHTQRAASAASLVDLQRPEKLPDEGDEERHEHFLAVMNELEGQIPE